MNTLYPKLPWRSERVVGGFSDAAGVSWRSCGRFWWCRDVGAVCCDDVVGGPGCGVRAASKSAVGNGGCTCSCGWWCDSL
eukprot:6788377-Alexandrium_andersonii.AAC.1